MIVQGLKFIFAGLINTFIGLGIILTLVNAGFHDLIANALGYCIGFAISFYLNGRWTFGRTRLTGIQAAKFIFVVAACYIANVLVILILKDGLGMASMPSQTVAVAVYSASSFLLFRFFVFSTDKKGV